MMQYLLPSQSLNLSQENLLPPGKYGKTNSTSSYKQQKATPNQLKWPLQFFLTCIGPKGREIYSTFAFDSPQDEISLEIVLAKFDA